MLAPKKLLVIDVVTDSGTLLVRALARNFPTAMVQLCGDLETATSAVATDKFDAIAVHRTEDLSGIELIHTIRAIDGSVPIIAVSGNDRATQSLEAGASAFLLYDEWLRVGTVVQDVLRQQRTAYRESNRSHNVVSDMIAAPALAHAASAQ